MNRQAIIDSLMQKPDVSVLIVGAGINGIGTFRDLALQGVDVLLVDKADFCSGASAASSRNVHGGIRYLELGDFRLVREALAERNRLLQNAPHAVHPLMFTIPVYSWFSGILNAPLKFLGLLDKPSERGALVVKLGMMFYDWFTRHNRMTPTHRMLSRRAALAKHPHLDPNIIAAGTYYDAAMPYAERIGVELVLDAENDFPAARALNYVSLVEADQHSVQLRDEPSGATFAVKPQLVVNATGAWIDFVNRALNRQTKYIRGTKGSHIIVDHPELAKTLNGSAIFFENKDGRMCIFCPLLDKVMIGATDIYIDDPDQAICTDEEIDYFLSFSSHILPGIQVKRSHIVYHFSGVRPLPSTDEEFTGLISRDHSIRVDEPDENRRYPVYSLVSGKWTTFRAFAEQTTDKILAYLGKSRQADTRTLAIGGGRDYPRSQQARADWLKRVQSRTGLPVERLEQLFDRYGTGAEAVAVYITAGQDEPLRGLPDYSRRELRFIAETEKVVHLDDIILRRSLLGMLGQVNGDILLQLGDIVGPALDWSAERTCQEIERAADILQHQHGVPAERLRQPAQSPDRAGINDDRTAAVRD